MLKQFKIDIEPEALDDIQNAVEFYNLHVPGLGKRFYNAVDKNFKFLARNYSVFAVRYDEIRCMPVDKFPYLIHYQVLLQQKIVRFKAVFCTSDNPEKLIKRNRYK
jgi:toxin ParE1/3/4